MSWQSYVDTNLIGSAKIAKAAIIGQKGGTWAATPGFSLSPAEEQAILACHSNIDQTQANGIRANGEKYLVFQANGRSVYGKKATNGIIVVKTKQAILVAVYEGPIQAAEATPVVENLADYLISVGY